MCDVLSFEESNVHVLNHGLYCLAVGLTSKIRKSNDNLIAALKSSPNDVFSNMSPEARSDAYNKMLVASGPIFVFQESTSRPVEFFSPGKPTQLPALALTKCRDYNEQETNAVFYGSNHFHLVDTTARRETSILQAFLGSITSTNAHLLSHLSLSFPALEAVQERSEASGLRQDGMRSLKLL
ncbi:uncharacterized protein TrAtP1_001704 [Trichoderma atroviride]|uniref:uncharacterized protein n=1 Tax=Hypocrea atroviridis TaxID=63577 RepID=UPI00331BEB79|nr:hypothetical protein TrAtP1_001704 [Trichoderma atroviride]